MKFHTCLGVALVGALPFTNTKAEETVADSQAGASESAVSEESATSAAEQANRFTLFDIPGLHVGLDTSALEQGDFAFDYKLELMGNILDPGKGLAGSRMRWSLLSEGYISDDDENAQNSIVGEFRIAGDLLGFDRNGSFMSRGNVFSKEELQHQLLERSQDLDPFGNPAHAARIRELERRADTLGFANRFLSLDFHARAETTQEFDDVQYAFGAGLTSDLALFTGDDLLARLIDAPFRFLRFDDTWVAQLPRFRIGYDHVSDSSFPERMALTDDTSFSRLSAEVAWMTEVFPQKIQLRTSWRGYYELDAPEGIKNANKDFTSFVELSAGVPLNSERSAMAIVKYSHGELPPTLENSSNVAVGFRVEF